jgi:hypothetical protein
MFGIFQIFYCSAMLCGALVTLFGIGFFSNTIYFIMLTALGGSSFLYCLFFMKEIKEIATEELTNLEGASDDARLERSQ